MRFCFESTIREIYARGGAAIETTDHDPVAVAAAAHLAADDALAHVEIADDAFAHVESADENADEKADVWKWMTAFTLRTLRAPGGT